MNTKIKLLGLGLAASLTLVSCSDSFLEEKQNYEKFTPEIYNDFQGAQLRVNSIYGQCLPNPNSAGAWNNNCTGLASDIQSKATEEYTGISNDAATSFVDPRAELSSTTGFKVPDYFQNEQKHLANVWGRIRNINEAMAGIEGGSLSQADKDKLVGQCLFFRAWCYYQLVKWYGGVPIITEVQEPDPGSFTQRSSAKDCIDFIVKDLDDAAEKLAAATTNGGWDSDNWGRVTSGTALALKGRVLVLWASPMFNRANDQTRWQNAYEQIKNSIPVLNACGYDLYQTSDNINASAFARIFGEKKTCEDVFVTLFNINDGDSDGGKNNLWERSIRPINTDAAGKSSGSEPSAMLIDMFPMADGKLPATVTTYNKLERSEFIYERDYPFMNRDPRFYRTFAFPGVRWAYKGDASNGGANNNPSDGENYALWNYVWYTSLNDQGNVESGESYGADNLLKNKKGMYVRKRSDDNDVNTPLYSYTPGYANGAFSLSGANYIEIRYAEVLLNYAEAACGAGHLDVAVEQLQKIRARVGYTGEKNYGLPTNLASDQAACMSAILLERQIELAYEGKRFDDMRRWMLYDGGANVSEIEGAPSTWRLSGWGGNTCTWLGFTQFNGQRREKMEFRVADAYGVGSTTYDSDPLVKAGVTRCAPLDLRQDLSAQQTALKNWYSQYLVRKDNRGDGRDANLVDLTIHFYAKYYFLGLSSGAQTRNDSRLLQTIGWEDYNNGGANGTFDPLAETPAE
ncbi:MAG: RagB/SusD family nutrient uptake outer membrane protein [Prevotella sp.]